MTKPLWRLEPEEQQAAYDLIEKELLDAHLVQRVDRGDPAARRLWRNMDLCSMVEGAFGERLDPASLSDAERQQWRERLGREYCPAPLDKEWGSPFWILLKDDPVGTVLIQRRLTGAIYLPIEAFYLLPPHRGTGLAARLLDALCVAARRQGAGGIRLETYWVWQDAVRYYLRRRFWVMHWKHDLVLFKQEARPDYRVEIGEQEASFFLIAEGGKEQLLLRGQRHSNRLKIECVHPSDRGLRSHAMGTFALHLAVAGWPLIRSPEHWEEHWGCEGWNPEGLAYRIQWYEAEAKKAGWRINTPRIPGLAYPSYEELMAAAECPR